MSTVPSPYARQANFTTFEQSNPTTPKPGSSLDAEFNAVRTLVNALLSRLSEIQREDGRLGNRVVRPDCFSTDALTLIGSNLDPRGAWVTSTVYDVRDLVERSGVSYICVTEHLSGTFATDLAAGKWQPTSSAANADDVPFSPTGGLVSTDVQAAIVELVGLMGGKQDEHLNLTLLTGLTLAADKLPYASGAGALLLTDFTAAARTLVAAVDAAAQRVALGLGTAAVVNTGATNGLVPLVGAGDKLAAALIPEITAAMLAATLDLSGKALTLRAGWTYGAQTATTSGTTVELSTAIPSWATEVEILLSGVSTGTANQPPLVQLGDAGGYETTSYVASVAVIESTNTGETDVTNGFQVARAAEYAAADLISGVVRLTRWDPSEHLWLAQSHVTASGAEMHFSVGSKTLSEVLTSIRLNTPGGAASFDAGEARVRYR